MASQLEAQADEDVERVRLRETQSSDTDSTHSGSGRKCRATGKRAALVLAVVGVLGSCAVLSSPNAQTTAMKHIKGLKSQAKSLFGIKEEQVQGLGPHGCPTFEQMDAAQKMATTGVELTFPTVLRPPLKLSMEATALPTPWVGGHFMTRAYSGSVPGPTIRVKPGEVLDIELTNNLEVGPGEEACDFSKSQLGLFMNPATICTLNYTNFHTHGLHVSAEGNQDNIFQTIKPGEKLNYKIRIPENHMGGTHWYHPHKHHATAAQAGGGAHGALIVDDPTGSLPKIIEEMEEKLMFLSLVNIPKAMRLEAWGMGTEATQAQFKQYLWKNSMYPNWGWDMITGSIAEHGNTGHMGQGIEPQVVVNGQWRPKLTLKENTWYRFRFVFAAIEQRVEVHPIGEMYKSARCDFQLLSKDGVYLHEAPREIERIYLVSGSRADLLVSCSCGLGVPKPCSMNLNFTAKWQPMGTTHRSITMEETTNHLMALETGHPDPTAMQHLHKSAPRIKPFEVRRPCYLADLRDVEVPRQNIHNINLPTLYPMIVTFDGRGEVWGHETPPPLANLPVGSVQQWHLSGVLYHPFHLHVNPYQIYRMWNDPYYMEGDWHDTMLPTGGGTAAIRLALDSFTGHSIAHCHLLEHEDNGMMGYINITGVEGTKVTNTADPDCYNGPFPGPPPPRAPMAWR